MDKEYYKIEEVAVKTGLTKRAIRYYEDIKLIQPIRTESLYRLYTEEDIEKIQRIKNIKESLGFSLNDIRDILELEQDIKNIFDADLLDKNAIGSAIRSIEHQIKLIEEKEMTLAKVKKRYREALSKLQAKNS